MLKKNKKNTKSEKKKGSRQKRMMKIVTYSALFIMLLSTILSTLNMFQ